MFFMESQKYLTNRIKTIKIIINCFGAYILFILKVKLTTQLQ